MSLEKDFEEYNKLMKRLGSKPKTWEQYVAYRQGKGRKNFRRTSKPEPMKVTTYRRQSPEVPSGDTYDTFVATKKEMTYTGDKLMGIATMHKSNMVPVFKQEDAEDIARMRR